MRATQSYNVQHNPGVGNYEMPRGCGEVLLAARGQNPPGIRVANASALAASLHLSTL